MKQIFPLFWFLPHFLPPSLFFPSHDQLEGCCRVCPGPGHRRFVQHVKCESVQKADLCQICYQTTVASWDIFRAKRDFVLPTVAAMQLATVPQEWMQWRRPWCSLYRWTTWRLCWWLSVLWLSAHAFASLQHWITSQKRWSYVNVFTLTINVFIFFTAFRDRCPVVSNAYVMNSCQTLSSRAARTAVWMLLSWHHVWCRNWR